MILMARWMFGCVCLGREPPVICHSWIVLFLIPPVIVKCSSEFLMEFGINWHPAIRLSGRSGRGERRLGWHGNGNNLQFAREGWLGCHWPDVLCVLMTQEDFVVPIIVSSLICRHLFVQSLLCYNLFLIYSHQSRPLSVCSLIPNLIKVGRKPKFFTNFICLTIKVRRA